MNNNNRAIGVAIVGGGQGCLEILHLLDNVQLEEFNAHVIGVADLRMDKPGISYARKQGKIVTNDFTMFYSHPDLDLLIELTGDSKVLDQINVGKPVRIKVIDHVGARLFWDLIKLKADHRARTVLESTRDAYLVTNSAGIIMQHNQAAREMFADQELQSQSQTVQKFLQEVFTLEALDILHRSNQGTNKITAYPATNRQFPAEVDIFQVSIDKEECLVLSIRDCSEGYYAQQEISRLYRYEQLFNDVACDFALSRNLEQSLQYMVQAIGETLQAEGVSLFRLEADSRCLVLHGEWQTASLSHGNYPGLSSNPNLPFIVDNVRAGKMVRLYHIDILPEPDRSVLTGIGIKSLLGLPIGSEGYYWGVLFVENRSPRFWSNEEIDFLMTIISIAQNAVQRQEAQKDLKESEALYQVMVDSSLTGIYIVHNGKIRYVNNRMAEIFGYPPDEMIGMNPLLLTFSSDWGIVSKRDKDKTPSVHYHFRGVRKTGEIVWLECLDSVITIKGQPAIIGNIMDVTERMENEQSRNRMFESLTMLAVNMVEQRDPYTAGHQRRVAEISVALGQKMGLDSFELEGLRLAALLHDIGKFAVPIEILTKPGKIRASESQVIRLHSELGAELLADIPFPWDISSMVRQHHERMDGSGYPAQLQGRDIKLESRIIAVADVLEAMSSHRPYRASLGLPAAIQELIKNKGSLYDEQVVEALEGIIHQLRL